MVLQVGSNQLMGIAVKMIQGFFVQLKLLGMVGELRIHINFGKPLRILG